jgi:transcriptional regulator with XRE-family HTH domain
MADQLGDRIRKARRRCGLSGAELARRIGIKRQHLSAIEHNAIKEPSALLVAHVSDVLNVSADYLLSGRLEPRRSYAELDEIELEPAVPELVPA